MGGVPIIDHLGLGDGREGSWQDVATTSPRSEMDALLKSHFDDVMPALERLEGFHCRTARTDVANSNPARRFFEGGQP